jgi:ribonuclease HI
MKEVALDVEVLLV